MSGQKRREIFVAPNGARKGHSDHPALPITIPEIVTTANACFKAGASGIHAHVRDDKGGHILDAGLYGELLKELDIQVPKLKVQITTESVGQYSPVQQRALVFKVHPKMVSVAMGEMFGDDDLAAASRFYYAAQEREIDVQHIVYSAQEFARLAKMILLGTVPARQKNVLFVLGRYSENQQSDPSMLIPYLDVLGAQRMAQNWRFMVCAFGQGETGCLVAAAKAGGDLRVGFENNFFHADGQTAKDNASRVSALIEALKLQHI
ncbi:MAG: 3-keto-5-aminohexanoate cleavage protein [Devosiaceae bacterium]|nr:3-keto-5-aminohexanoate cleavage protein [Devosiaceae bacterium]